MIAADRRAKYRAANRELISARDAIYRAAHREQIAAYQAAYCKANREKRRAQQVIYRAANPGKRRATSAAWAKANPERVRATAVAGHRRRVYGLTPEQYEGLLSGQGGVCAVCLDGVPTDIDHNHDTGRVRGLLCGPCNSALGFAGDSPTRLRALTAYLEGSQA